MSDPIQDLYGRTRGYQRGTTLNETAQATPVTAETPSSLGETVSRGFSAGIEGIRTDQDYFKGIFNTITGDSEAAAINIDAAKMREARIADSLSGLETFKEFTDNPTFSGFLSQSAKIIGQVAPYALTTIGSGGAGAAVSVIGKGALTAGSRAVAKKMVRESIERTAKGAGTRSEKDLAELAYRLAHRTLPGKAARKLTPKTGAITGQLAEEFSLMGGANFGENLQIEGLSDQEAAYRALALAAPQAVIGVAGERVIQNAIFGNLRKIAKERGSNGSLIAELGKEIGKATGKGALAEGVVEGTQDGLQIAQRLAIDDNFTREEGLMRLAESVFAGTIGGGAMSGGGRAATGSISTGAGIMRKAGEFIENAREQAIDKQFNKEQYGLDEEGYTTQEPASDMAAQERALKDPSTSRNSVWVAGNKPAYGAPGNGRAATTVELEGSSETFYARYIPGRGTIVSRYADVVEAVANEQASDASLQTALGYSSTKEEGADISIEARDAEGNVVWAEATTEQNADAAYAAAEKQMPEGGSINRQPLTSALEERASKVNSERGPQVRNMDIDSDEQVDFIDQDVTNAAPEYTVGSSEVGAAKTENIGSREAYKPREEGASYAPTEMARAEFTEAFNDVDLPEFGKDGYTDVDFSDPRFASMSDSFLRQAAKLKRDNADTDVSVVTNPDGTHSVMQTVDPTQMTVGDSRVDSYDADSVIQGEKSRANTVKEFLRSAITKASESYFARKDKIKGGKGWKKKDARSVVTVGGKPVNLPTLINYGQRLYSRDQRVNFTDGGKTTAMRNGLLEILGALIADGYDIKIGGNNISTATLAELETMSKDLLDIMDKERASLTESLAQWDLDPSDPAFSGLLDQMEKDLSEMSEMAELGQTTPSLDKLVREQKAYIAQMRQFRADQKAGKQTEEPVKGPMMQAIDLIAGFNEKNKQDPDAKPGKPITLAKLLTTSPTEGRSKDATYEVLDDSGEVVVTGNKQVVQEFIDDGDNFRDGYKINKIEWDNVKKEEQSNELTFDEFTQERDVGFQEQNGVNSEPGMNIDPEQENVGGLSNPGANVKPRLFGFPNASLVTKIANAARKTLRLAKPVSILTVDELLKKSDIATTLFADPKVLAYVKTVAQDLKNNPDGGGRYIGFNDAHIILVDPNGMKNELQTALIVAHELGHALYQEQLAGTLLNQPLYSRLFKGFEKARDKKDAPASYKGERGFEEWYADQVAIWAKGEYSKQRVANLEGTARAKMGKNPTNLIERTAKVKGIAAAHFAGLAKKLKTFHDAMSKDLKARFGKESYTADFDSYMKIVVSGNKRNRATTDSSGAQAAVMPTYQQKVIVQSIAAAQEKQNPGFANAIISQITKIVQSDSFTPIYNFIWTADSRLRKIGGNKLADMFYSRSQDSRSQGATKLGFLKQAALESNALFSQLEDMIDGDINSDAVKQDMDKAFSDTPTAQLEGNALAVRQWFEKIHKEYIEPSNTEIAFQENYAPVVLKLSEIHTNPDKLVELILAADPEANQKDVRAAVERLVDFQQAVIDEVPIVLGKNDPAKPAEKALKLTALVKREALAEAGLLEDSDVALVRYIARVVKRVEWNRHTKDAKGYSIYEEQLSKLAPKKRREVEEIIQKYLGYNSSPLGKTWRTVNDVFTVMQVVAILPLATLGSLPELAGPVIASKEFGSIMVGMKEIVNTVRNREQARALARDLGVVTSQSVANAMMSQSELEFMGDNARKFTDGFFRVTLLDTYTKFTREFASNMGVKFLMNHADSETAVADSARYLKELDVTAAEVKAWSDSNQDFSTPEGKKVRRALQRFVESSTLRPNAAERPLWASDPRWALAWQLKGFFYSYGKVMLAGAKREAGARLEGVSGKDAGVYANMAGAAGIFALMGIATMPLAMVGMELREYAKYGLAWAIPGIDSDSKNYFRTDSLTWPQYLTAAFSRSFAAGPVTIASQMMQASDWGRGPLGAAAVGVGPSAETVLRIFTDGPSSTFTNRILPTGLL